MGAGSSTDRRDFDLASSATAQENFQRVAGRLESLIDQRDADVKAAMADYQATGVSDEYHAKEQRWNQVAGEVRTIIRTLQQSLERNDVTAQDALKKAKASVDGIG